MQTRKSAQLSLKFRLERSRDIHWGAVVRDWSVFIVTQSTVPVGETHMTC